MRRREGSMRVRLCLSGIVAYMVIGVALAGNAQAVEPSKLGNESAVPAPNAGQGQAISQQMGLDEALQAFEVNYRASESAGRFRELDLGRSQTLIRDLSALNAKRYAASKESRERVSLRPYILPVYFSRQKQENWKQRLPSGVRPPEVTYQTFAVTLNGKAYIIAPGHGARGDKRYFIPPKSDTAVRLATEQEAKHAISLDKRPAELPGKIVILEGKLPTGENVRFESAAVRGLEPLQVLLPDKRMSFHSSRGGVEVDYAKTEIFILPNEWTYLNRLRLPRAAGFSGAPAIEKTPEGDVLVGHFIGHHTFKFGGKTITLGILEDYDSIRAAVEKFAALPARETKQGSTKQRHH